MADERDDAIDTSNRFLVGAVGDRLVIMKPPTLAIDKEAALNLAAYLVSMADPSRKRFDRVLNAIFCA